MRFSAEYGEGLSNHLPMAALALQRLGATPDRVREFTAFYEQRLRLKDASEAAFSDRLAEELARDGRDAWLHAHVSRLTPGLGSGAFHGIIRTAYAVDSGEETDLPDAITSWVRAYGVIATPLGMPMDDAFRALQRDDRFAIDFGPGNIDDRIKRVAAFAPFAEYRIANPTLPELARIAVSVYLATAKFTALHMVTGCHATRVLQPYLGNHALEHLATALLAAYVTIGRPSFDFEEIDAPDWETLAAIAIASNDDHDLKLVYSCREEEAVYGWGLHTMAAALRLGPQR